ncbi:hypothetical protein NLX86_18795 [Streptomyces sp. A3M-1-3]|uniref:hypothetical protein n=1 Tax=Streptomyces sp. A3M-1-3 TaxID=2962044 RepID=UPI0020B79691|nr:hypothetical protein [Streptomyces sp. A3M-1-3]MCP3820066.1 hypothetical protein [Streptomyces sp. A3M-1-3]
MSRVPDLIDALVARFRTEEGLAAARVTDGPEVTAQDADDWVLVGYDGDPGGEFQAAVTEEEWAGLGASREETVQLPVTLLARRGDTDVKAARARVYELGAAVKAVLRADPAVGLPGVQFAVGATALFQAQTDQGIQARLVLTLACRTI